MAEIVRLRDVSSPAKEAKERVGSTTQADPNDRETRKGANAVPARATNSVQRLLERLSVIGMTDVRFCGRHRVQSGHGLLRRKCPLMAQSRHELVHRTCPLLGVKRTAGDPWVSIGNSRERDNVVAVRQQILGIGHALSGSSLRKGINPVQHDLD